MSPARSARARGIRFSNHSDFAVTPLDPMFILWTSVNRVSRSGQVIGPDERISAHDGLRALTIDAAYQYGEEASKGSIETGKLADLDDPRLEPYEGRRGGDQRHQSLARPSRKARRSTNET